VDWGINAAYGDQMREVTKGAEYQDNPTANRLWRLLTKSTARPVKRRTLGFRLQRDWPKAGRALDRALALAFACIVTGVSFETECRLLTIMDATVPARSTMYKIQAPILEHIIHLARASCERVRAALPPGTAVGFDACWGNRNSGQGMGALAALTADPTHPLNGKIVDFEIVEHGYRDGAGTTLDRVRQWNRRY
jgi:hypothetical protein